MPGMGYSMIMLISAVLAFPGIIGIYPFKDRTGTKIYENTNKNPSPFIDEGICAAKEIRTPTPFRALPPQSSASTSFAIAALL